MRYAIIVWTVEETPETTTPGIVYGWYESLATALKTCVRLTQSGAFHKAIAVKAL